MKMLPLVSVLLLCSAQPAVRTETAATPRAQCAAKDDPPPIECPMCGGNAQLHEKRTKFFCKLGATLFIWRGSSSGFAAAE